MDGNEEWRFNRRRLLRVLIPLVIFGQGKRKFELFKNYSLVAQLVSLIATLLLNSDHGLLHNLSIYND